MPMATSPTAMTTPMSDRRARPGGRASAADRARVGGPDQLGMDRAGAGGAEEIRVGQLLEPGVEEGDPEEEPEGEQHPPGGDRCRRCPGPATWARSPWSGAVGGDPAPPAAPSPAPHRRRPWGHAGSPRVPRDHDLLHRPSSGHLRLPRGAPYGSTLAAVDQAVTTGLRPHGRSRSKADQTMRRLLRVPDERAAIPESYTHRIFGASILLSATRCLLSYIVLPIVLPLPGPGQGRRPGHLGIPVGRAGPHVRRPRHPPVLAGGPPPEWLFTALYAVVGDDGASRCSSWTSST